jgi:hypothetical protein
VKLVATCDFHFGQGNSAEVLQTGDEFTPPGTGAMNVAEHAASLIRQGVALPPDHKKLAKRIENFRKVQAIVARGGTP